MTKCHAAAKITSRSVAYSDHATLLYDSEACYTKVARAHVRDRTAQWGATIISERQRPEAPPGIRPASAHSSARPGAQKRACASPSSATVTGAHNSYAT